MFILESGTGSEEQASRNVRSPAAAVSCTADGICNGEKTLNQQEPCAP